MKIVRQLGSFIVAGSLVLGVKFYHKSTTATEIKESLLAICTNDSNCSNAVNTHFQNCFNSSYDFGSRRRSASVDTEQLASCLNTNSGAEYFAAN
jgi:hypothetical protein